MRTAKLRRTTGETDVAVVLDLDGTGKSEISTGCGFLDHMLTLFARHGRFDLTVQAKGDTWVDDHHTVEDVGIVLGGAFAQALGEKRGVTRYGSTLLPMDEALILTAVDLSGRGLLCYGLAIPTEKVGTFDTCLLYTSRTARRRLSAGQRRMAPAEPAPEASGGGAHRRL